MDQNNEKKLRLIGLVLTLVVFLYMAISNDSFSLVWNKINSMFNKKTVADRIEQYGDKVVENLNPLFQNAKVNFPPEKVTLVFYKDTKYLELYGGNENNLKLIKTYEVLAASGKEGPKLKEGDMQVPEGIYTIEALNPNSTFHLSLRLNYPNDFDKEKAKQENREKLGGDIMIHGNKVSIGCIAIGDEAAEELFILAAKSNWTTWKIILTPTDLRKNKRKESPITWIKELDKNILENLKTLPN